MAFRIFCAGTPVRPLGRVCRDPGRFDRGGALINGGRSGGDERSSSRRGVAGVHLDETKRCQHRQASGRAPHRPRSEREHAVVRVPQPTGHSGQEYGQCIRSDGKSCEGGRCERSGAEAMAELRIDHERKPGNADGHNNQETGQSAATSLAMGGPLVDVAGGFQSRSQRAVANLWPASAV